MNRKFDEFWQNAPNLLILRRPEERRHQRGEREDAGTRERKGRMRCQLD
jgi:hypothetical protein